MGTVKNGRRVASRKKRKIDYSKQLISDIRQLLWVVTVGGLLLAFYCVHEGYVGSLPWISAMVGLPWAAHGTVCSCYLNMAKSDHTDGHITYDAAKANGFTEFMDDSWQSPAI